MIYNKQLMHKYLLIQRREDYFDDFRTYVCLNEQEMLNTEYKLSNTDSQFDIEKYLIEAFEEWELNDE